MAAVLPSATESAKTRAAVVDEYGDLCRKMALWHPAINPHAQRHAELEAEILGWYEKEDGEKAFVAEGSRFVVPVKKRKDKQTVINVLKLVKTLGLVKIAELWQPSLNVIRSEISKDKRALYVKKEKGVGVRLLGAPVQKISAAGPAI